MYHNIFTGIFAGMVTHEFVDGAVQNAMLAFADQKNTPETRAQIEERIKQNLGIIHKVFPVCDATNNPKSVIDESKIVCHVDYEITQFHDPVAKEFILHLYPWKDDAIDKNSIQPEDRILHAWVEIKIINL